MADVNKSVQISYRADLKQLIGQLKQMPGISDTEAKKMVSALDRQFKRAEASAKRAAKAQSKAMNRVSVAAEKAAVDVQLLGDQAGDMDRAFMGAAQAANIFSPALGGVVMLGSDAAAIFEAVTLGLKNLKPAFLGIAGVIGAAVAVFGALNMETEKQQKLAAQELEVQKQRVDVMAELAAIATTVTDNLEAARIENQVLRGEITQGEADRLRIIKETNAQTEAQTQTVTEQIRKNQQLLAVLSLADERKRALSDTEKEQLRLAQLRLNSTNKLVDIEKGGVKGDIARFGLRQAINKEIEKSNKFIERTIQAGEKIKSIRLENLELAALQAEKDEYLAELEDDKAEDEANREQRQIRLLALQNSLNAAIFAGLEPIEQINSKYDQAAKKLKEQAAEFENIASISGELNTALVSLEKQRAAALKVISDEQKKAEQEAAKRRLVALEKLVDMSASAEQSKLNKIKKTYEAELKLIAKLETESGDHHQAELARQAALSRAIFDRNIVLEELHQDELERIAVRNDNYLNSTDTALGGLEALTKATLDYLGQTEKGNQDTANKIFKLQQGLAYVQILMNTSVGVTKAFADLGPAAGALASIGIIAGGAAAAMEVMSQSAPTMHMGGIVSQVDPDERRATVLSGEAVLDRGTVSRLGGEQGIRDLQAGRDSTPLVIAPFKHFDRFLTSELRRPSRLRAAIGSRATLGAY